MKHLEILALTMEEAECMLKILDSWYTAQYNVMGVKRINSWNERQSGIATIAVEISDVAWSKIQKGASWEMMRKLGKSIEYTSTYVATTETV